MCYTVSFTLFTATMVPKNTLSFSTCTNTLLTILRIYCANLIDIRAWEVHFVYFHSLTPVIENRWYTVHISAGILKLFFKPNLCNLKYLKDESLVIIKTHIFHSLAPVNKNWWHLLHTSTWILKLFFKLNFCKLSYLKVESLFIIKTHVFDSLTLVNKKRYIVGKF